MLSSLFFLLLLITVSAAPSFLLSSPLPTVAVAQAANNTLVCALKINSTDSDPDRHSLTCTQLPSRNSRTYSSGSTYYAGVVAGNDFVCGLATPPSGNLSSMIWWHLSTTNASNLITKRIYKGDALEDLGAGDTHVCGLIGKTKRITCWRWQSLGRNQPTDGEYTDLAVGNNFVCGLLASGTIRCFGNMTGVVGHELDGNYSVISAGAHHVCGLTKEAQKLQCWGSGTPVLTASELSTQFLKIALGRNRTCAIRHDGTVACWGDGGFGLPERLRSSNFVSIFAKGEVFCGVLTANYSLMCWGSSIFEPDPKVFDHVLPGPCERTCPCGPLPGSAILCPSPLVICSSCKLQIPSPPSIPNSLPPGETPPASNKSNRWPLVYMIVGAVGIGIALLTLTTLVFFRKSLPSRIRVNSDPPTQPLPVSSPPPQRVSDMIAKGHSTTVEEYPSHLLNNITGNFCDEHKIGSGSFGSVYRATLDDGSLVAIKRAASSSATKVQAFLSELALLSRVNHRNLVRLLGYCSEGPELALVYEYMSNGTLHDHLHKHPTSPLSAWGPRLRVALDAARGLEYLHRYAVPTIIHRDIKPSNILLDDDWTAKVADFGLSLAGDADVSFPTAGTVGYMDPEYYRSENLTMKSDVYSFGVVLLELLTGRKAIHRRASYNGEPCNVVDYAVPRIVVDDVEEVLDPALPPPRPSEIEAVQQVAYLAADCVSNEGRRRPDMKEVVDELERAVAACFDAGPVVTLARSLTSHSV